MQKLKILHIIKSLGRGGAEMLLPETLKLHDTSNFEFHYIYFLPWKNQLVEAIENAGGEVTCLQASNNIKLLQQYSKVIAYCKTYKIDLIHCHLPWAGFLGRVVHAQTQVPVIYSEHNMQERYHIATRIINRLSFNSQSLALGVSDDVTNSIKKNINPRIQVKTLLNGVNTDSFIRNHELADKTKQELGIPINSIVIGNVAVFRFQKRLVEWLHVFKKIEIKNSNVYGMIVGAGPLEREIKAELNKLKLQNKVFLLGLKTNVKPYLSTMNIFMMSSSFEGLPIALLEAMSMECAIVSTDAGGIKEVIRNGEDGMTCKVQEWSKLSGLCQILINDPRKLNNYQKTARDRVVKNFSLKRMVSELEGIYQSLAPTP
jgi:L-malate glycosyltransferase